MKNKGKNEKKTRLQGHKSKNYGAPQKAVKMETLPLCLSKMGPPVVPNVPSSPHSHKHWWLWFMDDKLLFGIIFKI